MSGKRLMVMAGGTGGHVFPGLAVAHHLEAQGWQVRWLGTADRMEADLVPKHGIDIDFIRISGLRGKGSKALLLAPVRIFNAWRQARKIIKAWKPDVVLGMGGYVSGPGGLAAWSCGCQWYSMSRTVLPGSPINGWLKLPPRSCRPSRAPFRTRKLWVIRCVLMCWRCRHRLNGWLAAVDRFVFWLSGAVRARAF